MRLAESLHHAMVHTREILLRPQGLPASFSILSDQSLDIGPTTFGTGLDSFMDIRVQTERERRGTISVGILFRASHLLFRLIWQLTPLFIVLRKVLTYRTAKSII